MNTFLMESSMIMIISKVFQSHTLHYMLNGFDIRVIFVIALTSFSAGETKTSLNIGCKLF